MTNPPTILFFAGIFASLGAAPSGASSTAFTACIFASSALWWMFLTAAVAAGAAWLTPRAMMWINRVSDFALGVLALQRLRRAFGF